jgi:protein-S-isoprenylcysteine O-methyltransferase Ste14
MNAMRICLDLWMVLALIWLITSLRTRRTQERVDIASRLLYGIPVILGFVLMFDNHFPMSWLQSNILPANVFPRVLGVALTAFGLAFAVWARFSIGQNWSSAVSIKVEHQLVRTGPYAWVRHPIYSGILLMMIGTAVVVGQVRGVLATLVLWSAFWVKSRMEESFMLKTFGQDYTDYSRSTGALVPRIRPVRFSPQMIPK